VLKLVLHRSGCNVPSGAASAWNLVPYFSLVENLPKKILFDLDGDLSRMVRDVQSFEVLFLLIRLLWSNFLHDVVLLTTLFIAL
jgi:hypothetical protein